jgi:hypothetical protein
MKYELAIVLKMSTKSMNIQDRWSLELWWRRMYIRHIFVKKLSGCSADFFCILCEGPFVFPDGQRCMIVRIIIEIMMSVVAFSTALNIPFPAQG